MNRQSQPFLLACLSSSLLFGVFGVAYSQWRGPELSLQENELEECTIGAASGRATKDGRPMIWKTRDTDTYDNAVVLVTTSRIPYLSVIDAGSRQSSWMSLNAWGFVILNSVAYDLNAGSSGLSNGPFMAFASGTCSTVADFQHLLDSTNVTGRRTYANFVVMDSTGVAAIFETSGSAYWKFDATDSIAYPSGYVLRTNFTMTGGGSTGIERFNRTTALFQSFSSGDSITPKSIFRYQMRDFANSSGVPYPIPYRGSINGAPNGYIPANTTICRVSSASAAVMQGIRPGESALMSTFWVILGCPATGIVVPYWLVGSPPAVSTDVPRAALNDTANAIKSKILGGASWPSYFNTLMLRNDDGTGLLPRLFATEDVIFASADSLLTLWRAGQCSANDLLAAEARYAGMALTTMSSALTLLNAVSVETEAVQPSRFYLSQNYPNPFNPTTTIRYSLPVPSHVSITVFNALGQSVASLVNSEMNAGDHNLRFDASGLPSGMYVYRLQAGEFRESRRMLLLR